MKLHAIVLSLLTIPMFFACSDVSRYDDAGVKYYAYNAGTVGQEISSEITFTSTGNPVGITQIDANHIAISYAKGSTGVVKIGTLSGTEITWGTEYVFSSTSINISQVAYIDSGRIAVLYSDSTSIKVKIGLLDSSYVVTGWGLAYSFTSNVMQRLGITAIDSNHVAVAYSTNTSGLVRIGTISGTTITWSSDYTYSSINLGTVSIGIISLDSSHIAVSFNTSDNFIGKIVIGTLSNLDSIISWSDAYIFNSEETGTGGLTLIDSNHLAVCYNDRTTPYYGKIKIGTIEDNAITGWSEPYIFNSGDTTYTGITYLNSRIVVVYNYSANVKGKVLYYKAVTGTSTSWDTSWTG